MKPVVFKHLQTIDLHLMPYLSDPFFYVDDNDNDYDKTNYPVSILYKYSTKWLGVLS